jgi:hypothetical protein
VVNVLSSTMPDTKLATRQAADGIARSGVGRTAFPCAAIAEPLAEILTGGTADGEGRCGQSASAACETLLRLYVHAVVDRDKLLKTGLRSVASGASLLVKPRDLEHSHAAEQPLPAALASRVPDLQFAQ